jgi:hypothetical protein
MAAKRGHSPLSDKKCGDEARTEAIFGKLRSFGRPKMGDGEGTAIQFQRLEHGIPPMR